MGMAKIRALNAIQVAAGQRLGLTPDQVRRRAHLVKHIDKDVYELTQLAQFKAGEELVWVGELPKHYAGQVDVLDQPEAQKAAPPAAKKAAPPAAA